MDRVQLPLISPLRRKYTRHFPRSYQSYTQLHALVDHHIRPPCRVPQQLLEEAEEQKLRLARLHELVPLQIRSNMLPPTRHCCINSNILLHTWPLRMCPVFIREWMNIQRNSSVIGEARCFTCSSFHSHVPHHVQLVYVCSLQTCI